MTRNRRFRTEQRVDYAMRQFAEGDAAPPSADAQ
jgi:hypothetical protein